LTFHYPARRGRSTDRHVLIDFGSTGQPQKAGEKRLLHIANNIAEVCGGKLHAVVATHRHKDHISGFTTNDTETAPGNIIAHLKPDIVVQPWTEDPKARPNATGPTTRLTGRQAFVSGLADMQAFAAAALEEAGRRGSAFGKQMRDQLDFLGQDNLANLSAITNLMTMGKRHVYIYHGSKSGLEALLPGVRVTVLGPPTLEQTDAIRRQRARDESEFWHLQAAAGTAFTASGRSPFAAKYKTSQRPAQVRWFLPRLDALRGDQLLEIVRQLDKQMNNTSVILLFEVGDQKLLFPGDAQIENWSYTLEQMEKNAGLRQRLAAVNLYKVGHHGSLNATPKSLWELFEHKGGAHTEERLKTVVSTMAGKHGKADRGTEVPRRKLVEELEKNSDFFTTQSLKGKTFWHDVEIDIVA
jgi:hypothetical protein